MASKERACSVCENVVNYPHKGKPTECPHCGAIYWDKPKDERDLFLLQDTYIENGRKKEDLGKMYEKLVFYAANIIKHKLRNKHILPEEDLQDKANDIALIMIERYIKRPDEKINHSFGGMMMWIANGVLYGGKKDDQVESLNETVGEGTSEIGDILHVVSSAKIEEMESHDPQNSLKKFNPSLSKDIYKLIQKIYTLTYKTKSPENLLYLVGLLHVFTSKKETFFRDYNNLMSNSTKNNIELSKLVIRDYVLNQR